MTETNELASPAPTAAAVPQSGSPATGRLAWLLPLLALVTALVMLRCWVAGRMDFETDEAYYWLWSRKLAASYFDHPPMIAYFIRIGTALFGDTRFGVRSMAIVAIIIASVLVYALTVILFDTRRGGLLAVLWFNLMPHTTFFAVIMYPDTPAILFWLLTCVAAAQVWKTGRGEWWYLVGAALGLLLLSKYTGVFLLFGIAAWLAGSAKMRVWLTRPEPYIAAVIALVLFSPVIIWNAQHHWASFAKQFGRALDASAEGGFVNAAGFVGIQALFVSPLIFAFAIAGLAVASVRGFKLQEANWQLLFFSSAPMLLYFLIHALAAEVLPQWPSAAYPAAVVAAVAGFAPGIGLKANAATRPLTRFGFAAAPWVGLLFTLTLCAQMTIRPVAVAAAHDPLGRFAGWAELAAETRAVAEAQHAGYIASGDYGTNATLGFYVRDMPVFQASEAIRYIFLPPIDQTLLAGTTGVFVAAPDVDDLAELQKHFDTVALIATLWRARDGDPIEPYRVYKLAGYRGGVPF